MTDAIDPRSAANLIIDIRRYFENPVTHLELQKLVYFCHEGYLRETGNPLVAGSFEAWDNGPVHPVLWGAFKHNGREKILLKAKALNLLSGDRKPIPRPPKALQSHIFSTLGKLEGLDAWALVELSHRKNGAWDKVYYQMGSKGSIIPNDLIRASIPLGDFRSGDGGNLAAFDYEDIPPYND
ncbi:MAG: type II toxin-antitoxin system antitoxin SocA domain-containing protein [Pseudomonadota bacterium]